MRTFSVGRTEKPTLPHGRGSVTSRSGVTLIEMLVVVMIIALFAAIVGPELYKKADVAKIAAARVQIHNFKVALGTYRLATSVFPTSEQGLRALRAAPQGVANWDGPYLEEDIPLDPWRHPYVYKYPGEHGDAPDIVSYGADGQPGGDGINADILSWKN